MPDINFFKYFFDLRRTLSFPRLDLAGKAGIGYEITKHLASMGPKLIILACRDETRGQEAVERLAGEVGCAAEILQHWPLDLCSFDSVKAFAERFQQSGLELDILVQNAGIVAHTARFTEDGWERTLQCNYLSNILLSILLLPSFGEIDPKDIVGKRIINVSSDVHRVNDVSRFFPTHLPPQILRAVNDGGRFKMPERYAVTKVFGVLAYRSMARMLGYNGITVISADPGPCYTDLTKQAEQESMVLHIFMAIWRTCFMRSTEVGSRTVVKAALVKDKENYHGRYMTLGEIEDDGQYANSQQGKELEVKLWDETVTLLATVEPRVLNLVRDYLTS